MPRPAPAPSLLALLRAAAPALPLEPALVHVLLLAAVAGNRNVLLRTPDDDVALVARLAALALDVVFGYTVHRIKCHPNCAHHTPAQFLRSLFFPLSTSTPQNPSGAAHRHGRRRRISVSRNSAGKLPVAPSPSVGTSRSRRTSLSCSNSDPGDAGAVAPPQLDSDDADPTSRPCFHPGLQSDTSVPTLASNINRAHSRNVSRGSSEALKLPSVVVVSGLELASIPSQKAVLRTLAERKITVSEDEDDLTLELPDGFFIVYVCRSDPRERPPIHKSLLDRFALSSSIDVSPQVRSAMRQYRPPSSPSTALSSQHTAVTSAAFSALHPLGPQTPPRPPVASPMISSALLQRLKHLCTQARIRPPLNIYLADLFSATRHYGSLDGMMLTVRARQDAEALIRANRVLGADSTGAELIIEHGQRRREAAGVPTYPHSHTSVASSSSDGLLDDFFDVPETFVGSSLSRPEQPTELDVSEADIARMFPRVVSHRIRVRDSPFDEVLSSAVCGAVGTARPGRGEDTVQWERETVKDILVHILAEV